MPFVLLLLLVVAVVVVIVSGVDAAEDVIVALVSATVCGCGDETCRGGDGLSKVIMAGLAG